MSEKEKGDRATDLWVSIRKLCDEAANLGAKRTERLLIDAKDELDLWASEHDINVRGRAAFRGQP